MSKEKTYPACRPEDRKVCPSHPGAILKGLYLDELHVTISAFAERIGVSRKVVSAIVNERQSVTPEMSLRFAAALKTTPDIWINLQRNYDLWQAKHAKPDIFSKIKPIAAMI
jgi:addiction module HigA family antidote